MFWLELIIFSLPLEMDGLTDQKSPSWVKHAVRKWKELYYEILRVDGQIDLSNPLSAIFRNEIALLKGEVAPAESLGQSKPEAQCKPPTTPSVKKEGLTSPKVVPKGDHPAKSKGKQTKGRFIFKLKKIQCFSPQFPTF